MKSHLEHKTPIIEGCRRYFIELANEHFQAGGDWNTLEKITRLDDSTLRRWHSGQTISEPNLGNMLSAIISLGGTAVQAMSYSGCSKLAFVVSILESDPELLEAVYDATNSPMKEKLRQEAIWIQQIVKKSS